MISQSLGGQTALLLSHWMPDPNGMGVQQRIYRHLLTLTENFDIDLIVAEDCGAPAETAALCRKIVVWPGGFGLDIEGQQRMAVRRSRVPLITLLRDILANGVLRRITARRVKAPDSIVTALGDTRYDLGFCFRLIAVGGMTVLARAMEHAPVKIVLDLDDIESKALTRALTVERARLGAEAALIQAREARRRRAEELDCLNSFDLTLICSDADRGELSDAASRSAIAVVPNTVAVPTASPENTPDPVVILFVGTLSYSANIDGIIFFCRDILPLVRARVEGRVSVRIVGYRPDAEIVALGADPDIEIFANVESIAPFYRDAHVVIVPIRYGGGTRTKILEAQSYQRAVVATTIGAEGLDLSAGRDVMIADSASEFADACSRLIEEPEYRRQLAATGRQTVIETYSLEVSSAMLRSAISALYE